MRENLLLEKRNAMNYAQTAIKEYFKSHILHTSFLEENDFSFLFRIKQDISPQTVILKVYKKNLFLHRKESYNLWLLSKNTTIPFPQVFFLRDKDALIPFDILCIENVKGKNCAGFFTFFAKNKEKKQQFCKKVVEGILQIHCFKNDGFGLLKNPKYSSWNEYYKPYATEVLEKVEKLALEKKVSVKCLETMEKSYSNFELIFSEKIERASLIHGDLSLKNILVDNELNPLAFISPIQAKFADVDYDMFYLKSGKGIALDIYNTYKKMVPVDQRFDCKCSFYALWKEMDTQIKNNVFIEDKVKPLIEDMDKQLLLLK